MLTRSDDLLEEQGMIWLADADAGDPLATLQAASCTCRIAFGPRAGQKSQSLRPVDCRVEKLTHGLCTDAHGFSLLAAVRCGTGRHAQLEPPSRNGQGQVVLKPKSPCRDATTHIVMQAQDFVQRLAGRLLDPPATRRGRAASGTRQNSPLR